jgi:hypothetical protein
MAAIEEMLNVVETTLGDEFNGWTSPSAITLGVCRLLCVLARDNLLQKQLYESNTCRPRYTQPFNVLDVLGCRFKQSETIVDNEKATVDAVFESGKMKLHPHEAEPRSPKHIRSCFTVFFASRLPCSRHTSQPNDMAPAEPDVPRPISTNRRSPQC